MQIRGHTSVHRYTRILEITAEEDGILISIHHPTEVASGEKVKLTVDVATQAVEAIDRRASADLPGRMRKEKSLRVNNTGDELYLWIRNAGAGDSDGWEILVPADGARRALAEAMGR